MTCFVQVWIPPEKILLLKKKKIRLLVCFIMFVVVDIGFCVEYDDDFEEEPVKNVKDDPLAAFVVTDEPDQVSLIPLLLLLEVVFSLISGRFVFCSKNVRCSSHWCGYDSIRITWAWHCCSWKAR